LTRLDYLLAKVSAMGLLMSTIIFGPPLLLFLGLAFTDDSPIGYVADNITGLLKIASYGILVSAFFAALGLIIATFTTRKGIAAAILIIGVFMLTGISNGFYEALEEGRARGYFLFGSPTDFIDALRRWIFVGDEQNRMFEDSDLPGVALLVFLVVVVAVAVFFMHRTYLREE
jgi:ABC-2 type transport system permease protein